MPRRRDARGPLPRLGLAVAAAVLAVDQLSKLWVVDGLMSPPRVVEVAPFLNLVMVWNRGASFGLLGDAAAWVQYALGALALAVCCGLAAWLLRARTRTVAVALGLVIGGAAGNLVDRALRGAVADFVDLHALGHHWPAFNAADAAITCGVALLVLDALILAPRADRIASRDLPGSGP